MGKTTVIELLLGNFRSKKQVCLATAISGIAANLLSQGGTVHSKVKVPINLDSGVTKCNIKEKSALADLIRMTDFMVIDEATMGDKLMYECVDRSFREIRKIDKPFGGVTMLFSGDWRQTLPIVPHADRAEVIRHTLKRSNDIWPFVKIKRLTENMRVKNAGTDDQNYADYLLKVGEGKIPHCMEKGEFMIEIPEDMKFVSKDQNLKDLVNDIFPEVDSRIQQGLNNMDIDDSQFCKFIMGRAIICATNDDTEEVNDIVLDKITCKKPADEMIYYSADRILNDKNQLHFPTEFLNKQKGSGFPRHKLRLKKGATIMLLRHLDKDNGHLNGARYYVVHLGKNIIQAKRASGKHKGKMIIIPRIKFHPKDKTLPFEFERCQFPVKVCYGMTANKAQGQTLKKIGINLTNDFFSHGQLYVALSRVGSSKDVKIFRPKGHPNPNHMKNVVYQEILTKNIDDSEPNPQVPIISSTPTFFENANIEDEFIPPQTFFGDVDIEDEFVSPQQTKPMEDYESDSLSITDDEDFDNMIAGIL